jgi:hypothetical protein
LRRKKVLSSHDKALERAFAELESLPDRRQDESGHWLLDLVDQDQSGIRLSVEQQAELGRRVHDEPEAPVSEDEVEAFFSKLV